MKGKSATITHSVLHELSKVRPGLLPLMFFTALLGVMNILLVNQKIVLYVFYLPVIMAAWSVTLGRELDLKGTLLEEVRIAALLHDVGKVNISVDILRKTAALSTDERHTIEEHTVCGASLVRPIGGMLGNIADVIEAHHENYDGTGYAGLKGEAIPRAARIIAVADVFDALLSDRPYRKSIGVFNALDNIVNSSGSRFDPKAVEAIQGIINRGGEEVVAEVLEGAGQMLAVNL